MNAAGKFKLIKYIRVSKNYKGLINKGFMNGKHRSMYSDTTSQSRIGFGRKKEAFANYKFWVQDRLYLVISVFCFPYCSMNAHLKLITKTVTSFSRRAYNTTIVNSVNR